MVPLSCPRTYVTGRESWSLVGAPSDGLWLRMLVLRVYGTSRGMKVVAARFLGRERIRGSLSDRNGLFVTVGNAPTCRDGLGQMDTHVNRYRTVAETTLLSLTIVLT